MRLTTSTISCTFSDELKQFNIQDLQLCLNVLHTRDTGQLEMSALLPQPGHVLGATPETLDWCQGHLLHQPGKCNLVSTTLQSYKELASSDLAFLFFPPKLPLRFLQSKSFIVSAVSLVCWCGVTATKYRVNVRCKMNKRNSNQLSAIFPCTVYYYLSN